MRTAERILAGHCLFLAAGTVIGWLYGRPATGLLIAALMALGWNLRQLLRFDAALRSKHFGSLKYGDGIWSRLYSAYAYQRQQVRHYRKSYRRLLKEIRKSTNAMPDGAIILNERFEIVLCNRAAEALAGFRRKQDRGQRVDNILRDPALSDYLKRGDFEQGVEVRSPLTDDGWLQCRLVPYGADQRMLLIQDVTERRRLAAVRRDFVANASHELRSPLTVVSGYLDSLGTDQELPAAWHKPIEQMQAQAARMNKIIAELLELSRLEHAGPASEDEIVDICGLLSAARKQYADKNSTPTIVLCCESRARLIGNAGEIESVIDNLLSNAMRHTPGNGKITLGWRDADGGAELAVTDTGSGIDPVFLPRLTERFFRVDPGRARANGGTGLGLAIVKHVLERHDAVLDIDSTPGAGSTFTCRFPARRLKDGA